MRKHDASYKPHPVFHGTNSVFMGVELELQPRNSRRRNTSTVDLDRSNWYCKYDVSLRTGGEEYVSHPRTLESWRNLLQSGWPFDSRTFSVLSRGYGMHVHASTRYLSPEYQGRRYAVAVGIRCLVRKIHRSFPELYLRICGRQPNGWCSLTGDVGCHYSGVGLRSHTLEFRIFLSTTTPRKFMERLEFVDACMRYAKHTRPANPARPRFNAHNFLRWILANEAMYPKLANALREMGFEVPAQAAATPVAAIELPVAEAQVAAA